ncbi:hypothetical protein OIU77_012929 [Salix suchowensis]|uniref:Mitochondrial glycoprotein n=1 Tax=Salix suchowensis TaxID=1278906 RepID=A0ABQ9A5F8_9ROSI|nr:hypothetical protein OIU77_012929 [Salix suchowensis]
MWKRALREATVRQPWSTIASKSWSSASPPSISAAVDTLLLRSLKEHYLQVSKTNPPPRGHMKGLGFWIDKYSHMLAQQKVNPPPAFSIIKGALDGDGPVLIRTFGNEEIKLSIMRMAYIAPDALGIHSVSLRPKLDGADFLDDTTTYSGPHFVELDERMRDAFHGFIEERGVNENLFNFLQAWLYLKEHRSLVRWFKTVGTYINENRPAKNS